MDISAIALDGMNQASARFDRAARQLTAAATPIPEEDSVDLSTAAVNLLAARNQFAASAKVAHVADDLLKLSFMCRP